MEVWAHRGCSQRYPEKPTGTKLDLDDLETVGITDIILNEPEAYVE